MCSLRKIPTRLHGTNFCTSSSRFASIFIRQPNGPKCTQIVRITPKHNFRVQWDGSGMFVAKNSDATSFSNFCTSSPSFAPSFVRQPNGPKCTQILWNALKYQFWVQWGGLRMFVAKNFDVSSFSNFCTSSARFAPRFVWQPNSPKCTQIVQNTSKGQFRVQWVGSVAFVAKNLNATSWHDFLH